jgi:hypothetical protein
MKTLILLLALAVPAAAATNRQPAPVEREPIAQCWVSARLSQYSGGPLSITGGWQNAVGTRAVVYQVPWSAQWVATVVGEISTTFSAQDLGHPGAGVTEILLSVYGPDPGTAPTCQVHTWIIQ